MHSYPQKINKGHTTKQLTENFLKSKRESTTLMTRVTGCLFPNTLLTPRYDPVFNDGLSLDWLKANWKAWRSFRVFDPDLTSKVGVFSYSRGGSHLFSTQFHYLKTAFCFGEGFARFDRNILSFRAFLLRSTFFVNGLQDKNPSLLTHLVFNNNSGKALQSENWSADFEFPFDRYWIYYLRNPMRTLISLNNTGKEKWRLTNDFAKNFCLNVMDDIKRICVLKNKFTDKVKVIIHEKFCQQPDDIFKKTCMFLNIPDEVVKERYLPTEFFKKFFRCGSTPVLEDDWLVSSVSGETIKGWGGNFNPVEPISTERAYSANIKQEIPGDILAIIKKVIGVHRFDIWIDDVTHRFEDISENDFL